MTLPWRRLASFGGLQSLSAIVPLIVLPVVIRSIGTSGWVGLSIGYGIGAAASILVALAWSFSGPGKVSGASPYIRRALYWESLVVRGISWPLASGVGCLACLFLAPEGHRLLACLMTIAMSSWGLTPSWYYIGIGRARGIVSHETVPRLLATVLSIPIVLLTNGAAWYPLLMTLGGFLGVLRASREVLRGHGRPRMIPGVGRRMRENLTVALSVAVGSGYTSLAVPLAQLSGAPLREVADLAGSSRLRTLSQFGTVSVTTALQGWVAEPNNEDERQTRRWSALCATGLTGFPIALALVLLGPPLSEVLFHGASSMSKSLSVAIAAGCIPYALSSSLMLHWLAPAGLHRPVAIARVLASLIGIPLVYFGAKYDGATGGAWGMTVSECINAGWQLGAVWHLMSPAHQKALQTQTK